MNRPRKAIVIALAIILVLAMVLTLLSGLLAAVSAADTTPVNGTSASAPPKPETKVLRLSGASCLLSWRPD